MDIKKILPRVQKNILLKNHTTFKIGGRARYFLVAKEKEDLVKAVKAAKKFNLPFFILGKGSNVLFSDKGYKGLVIKFQVSGLRFQDSNIYVGAGVELENVVKLAAKESLTGLEWAAGIPGTVGGAVYGNTGAFGFGIAGLIKSIEVLDSENLKITNFSQANCKFFNKDNIFKQKKNLIILSVVFKLKKGDKKEIQKKIGKYLDYRKKNHPLNFPSAGCTFKNQKGKIKNQKLLKEFPQLKEFNKKGIIPAAYLIDKCRLKGKRIGKAEISKKHANFIVNLGGAKAKDVTRLIKLAKQEVKNRFGISLEEEIRRVLKD